MMYTSERPDVCEVAAKSANYIGQPEVVSMGLGRATRRTGGKDTGAGWRFGKLC